MNKNQFIKTQLKKNQNCLNYTGPTKVLNELTYIRTKHTIVGTKVVNVLTYERNILQWALLLVKSYREKKIKSLKLP